MNSLLTGGNLEQNQAHMEADGRLGKGGGAGGEVGQGGRTERAEQIHMQTGEL